MDVRQMLRSDRPKAALLLMTISISLLFVSCGTDETNTEAVAGSPDSSMMTTTTSPIDEPDRAKDPDTEPIDESLVTTTTSSVGSTVPPTPGFSIDVSIYKTNLNNPSTPMGILCWTVWEVFRQHVLLWEDPTKISKDMNQLITHEAYVEINKQIRFDTLTSEGLPVDVVPFAEAFYRAINERFNGQSLDEFIPFDDLPGAEAFSEELVRSTPECEIPLED